jgi:conjugative transposon TraN protein
MKLTIYFSLLLLSTFCGKAQNQIPEVHLPIHGDLHFISPEPIQYVDISRKSIEGNIALPNVLRLRYKDSMTTDAVVTIAGEKFIAQYHLSPVTATGTQVIEIQPADTRPLDIAGISLSQPQLKLLCYKILCNNSKSTRQTKAVGLQARLNNIYTAGDYIFLDLTYKNKTNLRYDIDNFRFKIEDKKVAKATNVQSIEIKPELALFDVPAFSKTYRNIFVLKKLSFPGNKVLNIELSEKQISGRLITLSVNYKDVLEADIIPN